MAISFFSALIITLVMTIFIIYLLWPVAEKIGLIDHPGGRKKHIGNIPLIGGFAMFIGFTFGCLSLAVPLLSYRSLFAASVVVVLLGGMDDMHELSPRLRLVGQFIAAFLICVFGGAVLNNLGNLFFVDNIYLAPGLNYAVSILAVMTLINATNMLDGADGFAGSISLVQLLFLAYLSWRHGQVFEGQILSLLIVAVFGFLLFNFPSVHGHRMKKIFMGDAGSTFLGLTTSWFCIVLSQTPHYSAKPVTFLWIIALPLFDFLTVCIRRVLKKQSPFKADREHFHHLLQAAGFSSFQTVCIVIIIAMLFGFTGILLDYYQVPEGVSFLLFLAVFFVGFYALLHAWKTKKLLRLYYRLLQRRFHFILRFMRLNR